MVADETEYDSLSRRRHEQTGDEPGGSQDWKEI
jgi:hypothetical protein